MRVRTTSAPWIGSVAADRPAAVVARGRRPAAGPPPAGRFPGDFDAGQSPGRRTVGGGSAVDLRLADHGEHRPAALLGKLGQQPAFAAGDAGLVGEQRPGRRRVGVCPPAPTSCLRPRWPRRRSRRKKSHGGSRRPSSPAGSGRFESARPRSAAPSRARPSRSSSGTRRSPACSSRTAPATKRPRR